MTCYAGGSILEPVSIMKENAMAETGEVIGSARCEIILPPDDNPVAR